MNQPRPALDALRGALAATEPTRARQDALSVDVWTSGPALAALADDVAAWHTDAMLAQARSQRSGTVAGMHVTPQTVTILGRLVDLARAAAVHGYPRPALDALAGEADRLPSARTSDPSTSHDARPPQVRRGNMLAKLLVGFRAYERQQSVWQDATLTSEELARRLSLEHTEYAKRCSDLLALGYIRVALDDDGHERTRRGDSGRQRLVFELTDSGRARAAELGSGR